MGPLARVVTRSLIMGDSNRIDKTTNKLKITNKLQPNKSPLSYTSSNVGELYTNLYKNKIVKKDKGLLFFHHIFEH